MTLRIGFVGCGHIANVHAYSLAQLHAAGLVDASITATFDVDETRAEKLARRHGGTAARSLDALLDGVDVVWICTWTSAHRVAVEAAAARGLAVFCEKPLAPTLADCEQVAAALERVPHQVGLVLRHAPVFRAVAELAHDGRFGRVLAVTLRDDQYFPIQGMYGSTWRGEHAHAGGGTLIEHSIHDVDVLRWILGDPSSVAATTADRFGHDGIDDTAVVQLGFADGSRAVLVSVWHQVLSRGSSRRLEAFFEGAYCWTEDDYLGPLHVQTSDREETIVGELPAWASRLTVPEVYEKSLAQYAEPSKAFLDGLVGAPPRMGHPGASEALAAHRIVDAAYRSAANGGTPISFAL
jgi:predicted dehydrogenase